MDIEITISPAQEDNLIDSCWLQGYLAGVHNSLKENPLPAGTLQRASRSWDEGFEHGKSIREQHLLPRFPTEARNGH